MDPCQACRNQQNVNRIGLPHPLLSLVAAKSFSGRMANPHQELVYKCRTCGTLMCQINHNSGMVIFWYPVQSLPDWAKEDLSEGPSDPIGQRAN
jgi:hypothetical protein